MIFTTIQSWKDSKLTAKTNESAAEATHPVMFVAGIAKDLGLPKGQTLEYVKHVFVDPALAPSNVSVQFVRDNLNSIVSALDTMQDWPDGEEFERVAEMMVGDDTLVFKVDESNEYIVLKNKQALTESVMDQLTAKKARLMYPNVGWIKSVLTK